MSKRHHYTEEQKDFIRSHTAGRSYQEVTDLFNAKFGTNFKETRIRGTIKRLGLKNGRDCRFQPGQISWNLGRKGIRVSPATEFKKGHMPINHRPVGSERINVDGYIEIKIAEPKKWRLKHQVMWEQAYGPIPKGHAVIFANRDSLNVELNNLLLITRAELLIINQHGLQKTDADLTRAGAAVAKVMAAVYARKQQLKK